MVFTWITKELEPLAPRPPFPHRLLLVFCALSELLWFCKFPNHDPWQVSVSKAHTSVSNQLVVPIRLKFKLYAIFIEWGSRIKFLSVGRQDINNYKEFPSKISRTCYKSLLPKIARHHYWEMFSNQSLHDWLLFCRFFWGDSACSLYPATTTQLFSESLPSHALCSCFEILSTANTLCKFWRSRFQPASTYAFCIRDDLFMQKRNYSSLDKMCKCNKIPSRLSINTSIEWNLNLSSNNMNVF